MADVTDGPSKKCGGEVVVPTQAHYVGRTGPVRTLAQRRKLSGVRRIRATGLASPQAREALRGTG